MQGVCSGAKATQEHKNTNTATTYSWCYLLLSPSIIMCLVVWTVAVKLMQWLWQVAAFIPCQQQQQHVKESREIIGSTDVKYLITNMQRCMPAAEQAYWPRPIVAAAGLYAARKCRSLVCFTCQAVTHLLVRVQDSRAESAKCAYDSASNELNVLLGHYDQFVPIGLDYMWYLGELDVLCIQEIAEW